MKFDGKEIFFPVYLFTFHIDLQYILNKVLYLWWEK